LIQYLIREYMKLKCFHYICAIKPKSMADINRIKLVLVEKKRTSKWLSEQLGVTPSTVSKWCTNSSQPDISNLLKMAELLDVDIKELLVSEYKKNYLLPQEDKHPVSASLVE